MWSALLLGHCLYMIPIVLSLFMLFCLAFRLLLLLWSFIVIALYWCILSIVVNSVPVWPCSVVCQFRMQLIKNKNKKEKVSFDCIQPHKKREAAGKEGFIKNNCLTVADKKGEGTVWQYTTHKRRRRWCTTNRTDKLLGKRTSLKAWFSTVASREKERII